MAEEIKDGGLSREGSGITPQPGQGQGETPQVQGVVEAQEGQAVHEALIDVARNNILALEERMRQEPQVKLDLFHHYAAGVYVRELHIPKDTLLTSKIHRLSCVSMLVKGKMQLASPEFGSQVIEAPWLAVTPAGSKRAGFALEDSIFITCHAAAEEELKDMASLEARLIAPDFGELENAS